MITYKFSDNRSTIWVQKLVDGIETGEFLNTHDDQAYLIWLEEGNTPTPADPIPEPLELTPQEKLASAGLTVDELKVLLGIA